MSASSTTGSRKKHSKISDGKLDITTEEFDRIRDALKKEEFRKLFFEYVEEIQDPENRKIYEHEITELEKERGVEVTFIHPKPGFVIKSSIDGELKCFINIASCAEIERPTSEIKINPETGTRGMSWSIPMAQAASRDDVDAKSKHCKVYDVVFHPNALHLSQRNQEFRKCLIDTALDAVEREYHVSLDRANLKFPKLDYKGVARSTVIRKLSKNPAAEELEPHPFAHLYPKKPEADQGTPKVLPTKTKLTPKPQFTVPKYGLKYSHDVDLSEYTEELDAKLHLTVPRALIVEIELPLLRSAADCQLDVTGKSVYLLSERHGAKYKLKIDLPYTVDDKAGSARFDVDTRQLVLNLPVVRKSAKQQREMHDTLRQLSREDSGVELHSNSESPVEEEEEEHDDEKDATLSDDDDGDDNKLSTSITTTAAPNVDIPNAFLKSTVHYQLPSKFDCNILDNVMAFVLHVPNVQPDSVQTIQQSHSLHIQFATVGSGYYPTHYAFYLQLPLEVITKLYIDSVEAEPWDNNVVVKVTLSESSDNLCRYLIGLDSNSNLKEYSINDQTSMISSTAGSSKKKAKREQKRCDDDSKPLDISIARDDEVTALEVVIRPQQTCNTTTEDDEPKDEQQQQQQRQQQQNTNVKKLNKKQRKRNKKERSLSESRCDELEQQNNKINQSQLEDSSPERTDSAPRESVGTGAISKPMATLKLPQRKQRSYSECLDSSVGSVGSANIHRGILKRFSRYGPRPSFSESCSSMDECTSPYSGSVDTNVGGGGIAQSFDGIPEEERDDAGLSESCKKTVTFNDHIMKQVFKLDSSILKQKKKNQKRRDCKLRAQQRRLSEGDSVDYEDNINKTAVSVHQYFKQPNNNNNNSSSSSSSGSNRNSIGATNNAHNNSNYEAKRKLDTEADTKNSMIFEMDDDI